MQQQQPPPHACRENCPQTLSAPNSQTCSYSHSLLQRSVVTDKKQLHKAALSRRATAKTRNTTKELQWQTTKKDAQELTAKISSQNGTTASRQVAQKGPHYTGDHLSGVICSEVSRTQSRPVHLVMQARSDTTCLIFVMQARMAVTSSRMLPLIRQKNGFLPMRHLE